MERGRYRKRVRELLERAQILQGLTELPDRVTAQDLRQTADLMTATANDLAELITRTLPGCVCRRTESDTESDTYFDYAESCIHHGALHRMHENLKASYAKMESALKDEVRLRIVTTALAGTATRTDTADVLVRTAIAIADEALRQITREIT